MIERSVYGVVEDVAPFFSLIGYLFYVLAHARITYKKITHDR